MKKIFSALLLLPLFILAGCTSLGLGAVNLPARNNSAYILHTAAYGAEPEQQLDIYVPSAPVKAARPVVIFFYGGSWESGERDNYRFVGAALAQQGFIVVIPDYRKYPQVRFPEFMHDAAKATHWVAQNIPAYGGRASALHIAGHSAGAHMGALLLADESYLAVEGKDAHKLIISFAGLAGPYDFVPDTENLKAIFGPPARYAQMQVPSFITGSEAPMLLQWGSADETVGAENHEKLAARIHEKKGAVTVKTYEGIGHIGIIAALSWLGRDDQILTDIVNFFRAHEPTQ